jgi:hypothetical protein
MLANFFTLCQTGTVDQIREVLPTAEPYCSNRGRALCKAYNSRRIDVVKFLLKEWEIQLPRDVELINNILVLHSSELANILISHLLRTDPRNSVKYILHQENLNYDVRQYIWNYYMLLYQD